MPDLILPPKPLEDEPAPGPNCLQCRWFKINNHAAPKMGGGCRYNPPAVVLVGQQQDKLGRVMPVTMAFWPAVGESDWCSKFEPPMPMSAHRLDS